MSEGAGLTAQIRPRCRSSEDDEAVRRKGRTGAGRDLDNVAAAELDLGDLVRRHALFAMAHTHVAESASHAADAFQDQEREDAPAGRP